MTRRRLAWLCWLTACQVDSQVGSNFIAVRDAGPSGIPACRDQLDNDDDGALDHPFEPGCTDPEDDDEGDPLVAPACADGTDDDGDGVIDFPLEPGCESAADDDEQDPAVSPQCDDAIDNDDNGTADYPDDIGCYAAGDFVESSVVN